MSTTSTKVTAPPISGKDPEEASSEDFELESESATDQKANEAGKSLGQKFVIPSGRKSASEKVLADPAATPAAKEKATKEIPGFAKDEAAAWKVFRDKMSTLAPKDQSPFFCGFWRGYRPNNNKPMIALQLTSKRDAEMDQKALKFMDEQKNLPQINLQGHQQRMTQIQSQIDADSKLPVGQKPDRKPPAPDPKAKAGSKQPAQTREKDWLQMTGDHLAEIKHLFALLSPLGPKDWEAVTIEDYQLLIRVAHSRVNIYAMESWMNESKSRIDRSVPFPTSDAKLTGSSVAADEFLHYWYLKNRAADGFFPGERELTMFMTFAVQDPARFKMCSTIGRGAAPALKERYKRWGYTALEDALDQMIKALTPEELHQLQNMDKLDDDKWDELRNAQIMKLRAMNAVSAQPAAQPAAQPQAVSNAAGHGPPDMQGKPKI